MKKIDFNELQKIIPIKFRVGSKVGSMYLVLGYLDSRDVMDRFDSVVGPENRSREDYSVDSKKHCRIGVYNGSTWVTKSDVGSPTSISKEKGEASDAFKRAAINWGVGRFLYTLPALKITEVEKNEHQYAMTKFVKTKFLKNLKERAIAYGCKYEDLVSKYREDIEDPDIANEEHIDDLVSNFNGGPTQA